MNFISGVINHHKKIAEEKHALADLLASSGDKFPGSDYHPSNRKTWMSELDLSRLRLYQIVWPGTHDSATNDIGVPLVTRPFAECQTLSIYDQLILGARAFDVRIQQDRRVCHGILPSYNVDVVLDDIKRFLSETESELVLLEIRTEYQKEDPPELDKYLVEHLGDHLIPQDEATFTKGFGNRLQVFSTDFIEGDFVDACVGLTHARLEGQA